MSAKLEETKIVSQSKQLFGNINYFFVDKFK